MALTAYHWLTTRNDMGAGFDALFRHLRGAELPSQDDAFAPIRRLAEDKTCGRRLEQLLDRLSDPDLGWPMAHTLSWISVAGGDSVTPPWVRAQFGQGRRIAQERRSHRDQAGHRAKLT